MLVAALPDLHSLDLEAMKALVIAQHERYCKTLSSRATAIDRLTLLVKKLQHMLFGRKSEKVLRQIEQLELQIEDLVAESGCRRGASGCSPGAASSASWAKMLPRCWSTSGRASRFCGMCARS